MPYYYSSNRHADKLHRAAQENRLLHLCVDVQYAFYRHRIQGDTMHERDYEIFLRQLGTFNTLCSNAVPTIYVGYDVDYTFQGLNQPNIRHSFMNQYNSETLQLNTPFEGNRNSDNLPAIPVDFLCPFNVDEDKFIAKEEDSALTNRGLEAYLDANGTTDVIVTGLFLESCISATVKDLRERGIRVHLPCDLTRPNPDWPYDETTLRRKSQAHHYLSDENILEEAWSFFSNSLYITHADALLEAIHPGLDLSVDLPATAGQMTIAQARKAQTATFKAA